MMEVLQTEANNCLLFHTAHLDLMVKSIPCPLLLALCLVVPLDLGGVLHLLTTGLGQARSLSLCSCHLRSCAPPTTAAPSAIVCKGGTHLRSHPRFVAQ
jgi:hypothetical protein